MGKHHQRLDSKKKQRKVYVNQPHVRRREAKVRALKIRENIRREYVDKKAGKSYGSGCNDPSQKANEKGVNTKCKEDKPTCKLCGKLGHTTTRSRHCTSTTYVPKVKKGTLILQNVALAMYLYFTHTK